ncbi:hypothetical protein LX32DRAFT_43715 [Colletotrichum zoysiae]|uniref:Uncharacterized protein n=1 Tax=Colletotrichum zoysiae TaxID=1216348 RepID=A0AAD9HT34_9PEZI|nr:hypothetical protein LX32DRAFT_43715 [Colletotrichum zoysiae]
MYVAGGLRTEVQGGPSRWKVRGRGLAQCVDAKGSPSRQEYVSLWFRKGRSRLDDCKNVSATELLLLYSFGCRQRQGGGYVGIIGGMNRAYKVEFGLFQKCATKLSFSGIERHMGGAGKCSVAVRVERYLRRRQVDKNRWRKMGEREEGMTG